MTALALLIAAFVGFFFGSVAQTIASGIRVLQTRGQLEAAFDHLLRVVQTLPEPQRSDAFARIRAEALPPKGIGVVVTRDEGDPS